MKKSTIRIINRKMKSNISQLLGIILLLAVGVGFYITLSTISLRYEETAEQYFIDHMYADITAYGVFDSESIRKIEMLDGVIMAQGRNVRDYREGERTFRAVSLKGGVNIPYIYDGRLPQSESEIMLLKRNADAMGFSIGDRLSLGGREFGITGLAASPEYIYLVQNAIP